MYADYGLLPMFLLFNSDEEDIISSDEEVPFRDDENDESYDPKYEKCVFLCLLDVSSPTPSTFLLYFCAGKFLS